MSQEAGLGAIECTGENGRSLGKRSIRALWCALYVRGQWTKHAQELSAMPLGLDRRVAAKKGPSVGHLRLNKEAGQVQGC